VAQLIHNVNSKKKSEIITIKKRVIVLMIACLNQSDEPRAVLVRQSSSSSVESVRRAEAEQVGDPGSVNVRKAEESS